MTPKTGFSLIEILIVLGIISILISLPYYFPRHFSSKIQTELARDQFIQAYKFSLFEARYLQQKIFFCATHDFKSCDPDWRHKLMIFSGNSITKISQILWRGDINAQLGVLHVQSFPRGHHFFHFDPRAHEYQNGSIWLCEKGKNTPSWALIINKAGRIRVETRPNQSCS